MIYRQMPATWDPQFRARFYTTWGRESAIIVASTRSVEYPNYRQLLSIKAAAGGDEEYFVDGRRIAVGDDTFLILNANRMYASRVQAHNPMLSFSIFFAPGLLGDVLRGLTETTTSQLDSLTESPMAAFEFAERLHPHDRAVSPVLRHIYNCVSSGVTNELWYEEQLHFLLQRMVRVHYRERAREAEIAATRPATRKEIFRRLGLGVTFMHTNYRESLDLEAIASASFLSRFHFLRTFKKVYGVTPSVYLNRYRSGVAARLLATTQLSHTAIAHRVGFGSRTTLYRQLRVANATAHVPHGGAHGSRGAAMSEGGCSSWPPPMHAEPDRRSRAHAVRNRTSQNR